MPTCWIIAGPNGAGKTTFAEEFLPSEADCFEFVNADLIAAGLSPFQPEKVAFAAGRLMLKRIDELMTAGRNFAFETTLATRSYQRMIPQWKSAGYDVRLCFLTLPDPEYAIQRVAQRVSFGGHSIPVTTIRRRYTRGLKNLKTLYTRLVAEWAIYDAFYTPPRLIETGENPATPKLMEDAKPYSKSAEQPTSKPPSGNPWWIDAEAALKRASDKAIARALAAGLQPIVSNPEALPAKPKAQEANSQPNAH